MPVTTQAVLEVTLELYETTGESPERVAASLDVPPPCVTKRIDDLCRVDLLARTDTGVRPTVTGREVVDSGIAVDDGTVIDIVPES